MGCIWQQQRQLGVLPAFTFVAGMQTQEPDGGGVGDAEEETEDRSLLHYANQEPVNTGNAEEVAAFQRYHQAQRRVPASRAALRGWVRQAA